MKWFYLWHVRKPIATQKPAAICLLGDFLEMSQEAAWSLTQINTMHRTLMSQGWEYSSDEGQVSLVVSPHD